MQRPLEMIKKKFEQDMRKNSYLARHGEHKLVLILDHLKKSYNIGKIFRTAEVFSIHEIHVIGTKDFDPYPAKGSLKRVKCKFFADINDSLNELKKDGYAIFIFDTNTDNYMHTMQFPEKSAMLFGHEELGPQLQNVDVSSLHKIKIKQFGLTESLNVSIAASIAVYEYTRQQSLNK
jgi:tRNA G18 (ribose-2'-O)-methylase SpoU